MLPKDDENLSSRKSDKRESTSEGHNWTQIPSRRVKMIGKPRDGLRLKYPMQVKRDVRRRSYIKVKKLAQDKNKRRTAASQPLH